MYVYMCIDASLSLVCKEEYLYSLVSQGPSARLLVFVRRRCGAADTRWTSSNLNLRSPPPVANPRGRAWSGTHSATVGIAGGEGTGPCCWRGLVRGALPAPCGEGRTRGCPGVLCTPPFPKAGREGCLSQGQSQVFKKHPSRMSCGYLSAANTGHGRAQAGMHSPLRLTLLSSSLPQEQSPQREHTCTGRVACLFFPTYWLMRDPRISENTTGVLAAQAARPPLLLSRGYRKCRPTPSSF